MRKIIFYSFLCMGMPWVSSAVNQRTAAKPTPPLTIAERVEILKKFQDFLKKPAYNIQEIDLFIYKTEEKPTVVQPVEVQKSVTPQQDDLWILQSIGKSIKPEGNLAMNGQFVLCIHGNRILKVGDTLYAKYKESTYAITLKAIDRHQFVLQMNEQELTFQY